MDVILRELSREDLETEYSKENKDGLILSQVRFHTDLEQFEILYSQIYPILERDLKDCISGMGFRIKQHDIVMHTNYLNKDQLDFLVDNTLALMNGIIQAHNFKVQMLNGVKELNKQVLIME